MYSLIAAQYGLATAVVPSRLVRSFVPLVLAILLISCGGGAQQDTSTSGASTVGDTDETTVVITEQDDAKYATHADNLVLKDIPRLITASDARTASNLQANSAQSSLGALSAVTSHSANTQIFPVFDKIPPVVSGLSMTQQDDVYQFDVSVASYGQMNVADNLVFLLRPSGGDANATTKAWRLIVKQPTSGNYAIDIMEPAWWWSDRVMATADVELTHRKIASATLYKNGPSVNSYNLRFSVDVADLPVATNRYLHMNAQYEGKLMAVVGLDVANSAETFGTQFTHFTNVYPNREVSHLMRSPITFFDDDNEGITQYFVSPTDNLTRVALCPFADTEKNDACLEGYRSFSDTLVAESSQSSYLTNFPDANVADAVCHDDSTMFYYDSGLRPSSARRDADCDRMRKTAANEVNPYIAQQKSYFVDHNTIALDFDLMSFSAVNNIELQVGFFDELFNQIGSFVDVGTDNMVRKGSGDFIYSFDNPVSDHRMRVSYEHDFTDEQVRSLFPYVYVVVYVRDQAAQTHLAYEGKDFSDAFFFTQYGAPLADNLHKDISLVQIDSAISGGAARVINDNVTSQAIAQYLFTDKSLNDTSGNAHHASMVGSVEFVEDRHGNANSAASFDGQREYITSNTSLLNDVQVFTMEGWVKPDSLKGNRTDLFGQNDSVELGLMASINNSSVIQAWSATHTGLNTPSTAFTVGEWNHIAVVGSFGRFSIYINGELKNTVVKQGSTFSGSDFDFNIGGAVFDASTANNYINPTADRYFAGAIDDVTVFSIAMSAETVKRRYEASK